MLKMLNDNQITKYPLQIRSECHFLHSLQMYNFEGDFETVYTGSTGVKLSGLLDTYRGSTKIPQWPGNCGNVKNASDGTKFPSHIQLDDTLLFYRKSMCRSKPLVSSHCIGKLLVFRVGTWKGENEMKEDGSNKILVLYVSK